MGLLMKIQRHGVFLFLLLGMVSISSGKDKVPIEITADGENRYEAGIAYAKGNVVVRHGEDVIYADEITFDREDRKVQAYGNVRIFTEDQIFRGEMLSYDLDSGAVESREFKTARYRLYALGDEAFTPDEDVYEITNGWFTTHDSANPGYHLQAGSIRLYDNDRVVLKNVTFMVGGVPVFWLPYVSQSLNESSSNYELQLGGTSRWGVYALNTYRFGINEKWTAEGSFDYRTRRGFAGGAAVSYHPRAGDLATLKGYYARDNGHDIDSEDRFFDDTDHKDRYRFSYRQFFNITEDLVVTADLNLLSDRRVTEDFFESEYLEDREPDNNLNMVFYDDNFTATLLARKQFNSLFEVAERKPEFLLEFKRQRIPYTPLYYEGESSVTYFEYVFDGDDPSTSGRSSYTSSRYDTFHQILYPRQYMNWLNVTPRMGFRATSYSNNNVLGSADPESAANRFAFNAGLEASFKASKVWYDIKDERFAIDGVRHVVQPFVNVGYTAEPTDRPGKDFRGFDTRKPSTRARPINYTSYNSIDSIDSQMIVRHGVRNKIQTKRDGENVDLLDWVIYGDFDFERNEGALVDEIYPEVYNELMINPFPWLRFDLYSATGVMGNSFNEVNSALSWQVHPAVELNVGQRYVNNVPLFEGEQLVDNRSLLTWGAFWRLNENWQLSGDMAYETEDGRIQEQSYSVYRDLTHWNVAATAKMRSNEAIDDEYQLFLTFTLKAFPSASFSSGN